MTTPTYGQLTSLSTPLVAGGSGENIDERILSVLAILASGTNPDGTPTGTAVSPSNDTSGVTDTASFTALLVSLGATITGSAGAYIATGGAGTITLSAGNYYFDADLPQINSGTIGIVGAGSQFTTINATSAVAGTVSVQFPFICITNSAFSGHLSNALIYGFTVKGSSAGTYVSGFRFGDRIGQYIWDVVVEDFNKTGDIGWDFLNQYGWTEQMTASVRSVTNTLSYSFDDVTATGGTNSFDYGVWTLYHNSPTNGVFFGHANFGGSELTVLGNASGGASNYMFTLSANAQIKDCTIRWESEWDGTGTGPVTIAFSSGAQFLPLGAVSFINSGWQASTGGSSATVSYSGTLNMPSTETYFPAGRSFLADSVQVNGGIPYVPGSFYPNYAISPGTTALTTGRIYAYPFEVTVAHTFVQMGNGCTAGGTTAVLRFGIYQDAGGTPVGGALVLDAGTITAATATAAVVTISQLLTPGLYWLAEVQNSAAVACTIITDTSARLSGIIGQSAIAVTTTQNQNTGYSTTATTFTGALPTPFPAASPANPVPYTLIKA